MLSVLWLHVESRSDFATKFLQQMIRKFLTLRFLGDKTRPHQLVRSRWRLFSVVELFAADKLVGPGAQMSKRLSTTAYATLGWLLVDKSWFSTHIPIDLLFKLRDFLLFPNFFIDLLVKTL